MAGSYIYWADSSSIKKGTSLGGIRRIKPDGTEMNNIISTGIGRNGIHGVAVDWIAGNAGLGLCVCFIVCDLD